MVGYIIVYTNTKLRSRDIYIYMICITGIYALYINTNILIPYTHYTLLVYWPISTITITIPHCHSDSDRVPELQLASTRIIVLYRFIYT